MFLELIYSVLRTQITTCKDNFIKIFTWNFVILKIVPSIWLSIPQRSFVRRMAKQVRIDLVFVCLMLFK